jgi:hypothetical protein
MGRSRLAGWILAAAILLSYSAAPGFQDTGPGYRGKQIRQGNQAKVSIRLRITDSIEEIYRLGKI